MANRWKQMAQMLGMGLAGLGAGFSTFQQQPSPGGGLGGGLGVMPFGGQSQSYFGNMARPSGVQGGDNYSASGYSQQVGPQYFIGRGGL